MEYGVTVSPTTVETAEGEVVADFAIEGHPPGYDSHAPNFHGMSDFHVDKWGRQHHDFENVHFDEFDEDPEFEPDVDTFQFNNILELAGGPERYQQTLQWANNNLSNDQLGWYQQAINSGDPQQMEQAVITLMHAHQEAITPQEEISDTPDEPMYEQDQQDIFEELGGQHVYEHMTDWARETLSPEQVDFYNLLMSEGSKHQVRLGVTWLVNKYRQANTRV